MAPYVYFKIQYARTIWTIKSSGMPYVNFLWHVL